MSQTVEPGDAGGRKVPSVAEVVAVSKEKPGMPCAAATPAVGV